MYEWLILVAFLLALLRSAPRLGLKDDRLLLTILAVIAWRMSAAGVDALYCIAFVLSAYSMHRAFSIVDSERERRSLERTRREALSDFASFISSNLEKLIEEIVKRIRPKKRG